MLRFQPIQPLFLFRPGELSFSPFSQVEVVGSVGLMDGGGFPGKFKLLGAEFTHHRQHGEARLAVHGLVLEEAFVGERGERVEDCHRRLIIAQRQLRVDHRFRRRQAEPAGKYTQPPEQGLFVGVQQVVTPLDRISHCNDAEPAACK